MTVATTNRRSKCTKKRCSCSAISGNESLQAICSEQHWRRLLRQGPIRGRPDLLPAGVAAARKIEGAAGHRRGCPQSRLHLGRTWVSTIRRFRITCGRWICAAAWTTRGVRPLKPTAWARCSSYQGRFGAAINSNQEALKTFRDIKDRTSWMARVLGGYREKLSSSRDAETRRKAIWTRRSASRAN